MNKLLCFCIAIVLGGATPSYSTNLHESIAKMVHYSEGNPSDYIRYPELMINIGLCASKSLVENNRYYDLLDLPPEVPVKKAIAEFWVHSPSKNKGENKEIIEQLEKLPQLSMLGAFKKESPELRNALPLIIYRAVDTGDEYLQFLKDAEPFIQAIGQFYEFSELAHPQLQEELGDLWAEMFQD